MKRILVMGLFGALLGLFSCNAQSSDNAFRSVDVDFATQVIEQMKIPCCCVFSMFYLDCR